MTRFKNLSIQNKLILIQTTTAFIAVMICCIFFVLNDINTEFSSLNKPMNQKRREIRFGKNEQAQKYPAKAAEAYKV